MRNRAFIPQTPPSEDEWRGDRQIVITYKEMAIPSAKIRIIFEKENRAAFPNEARYVQ